MSSFAEMIVMNVFDYLLWGITGVFLGYEFIELLRGRHNLFSKMAAWLRPKKQ